MTPEPHGRREFTAGDSWPLKTSPKIKNLFQRRPPTTEKLAAPAEAERERDQIRQALEMKAAPSAPRSESPPGVR